MEDRSMLTDWVDLHACRRPESVALVEADRTWSYAQLADEVRCRSAELRCSPGRLVGLVAQPTGRFVVDYLATFAAGHAALLSRSADTELFERFRALPLAGQRHADHGRRPGDEPPPIHPDLALLLSTSGSTGSPKLVRLSHRNLAANARSIASYLGLGPGDAAITSLPLSYCYGLSVLHSHLVAGATTVLTDARLTDAAFWDLVERHDVSTLAGVPHSFELFERMGLAHLDLPALRRVTCAGGRLAPDEVVRWHDVGTARGWALYVMYGQTEATARMAYLPPHLARSHPTAVGRPVPGGEITLRPAAAGDPPGTGEILYRGPNVMMGYAEAPADLSRPAELTELATGDLGRFIPGTDLLEIVGRARRFVKPLGVRVDLDQLEHRLAQHDLTAACTGTDAQVTIAVETGDHGDDLVEQRCRAAFIAVTGLPRGCVRVVGCTALPRTASGKIDHPAVQALGSAPSVADDEPGGAGTDPPDLLVGVASVLGLSAADIDSEASFVDLGGDSLSYVQASALLESHLAEVPTRWHLMPLEEVTRLPRATAGDSVARAGWIRPTAIDTTAVLRAVGICAVVGTHMGVMRVQGGAHLMLAVAGYNFARFQLNRSGRWGVLGSGLRTAAHVGLPASLWITLNMMTAGGYSLGAALLVNDYTGAASRTGGRWEYWFFEAFVKIMLAASLLVSIPPLRRWEQRRPYGFALAVTAGLLAFRFDLIDVGSDRNHLFRAHTVAWFFALGWLVVRSRGRWRQLATGALIAAAVPGFFHNPQREWFIVAGLGVLVASDRLRAPRLVVTPLNVLAASSMWIFLFHWQAWPVLERWTSDTVAYPLVIAVGCLAGIALTRLGRAGRRVALSSVVGSTRSRAAASGPGPAAVAAGRATTSRARCRPRQAIGIR
ncbi:MAG: AMP-binding protein [Acidimicrobiales bacterium]